MTRDRPANWTPPAILDWLSHCGVKAAVMARPRLASAQGARSHLVLDMQIYALTRAPGKSRRTPETGLSANARRETLYGWLDQGAGVFHWSDWASCPIGPF